MVEALVRLEVRSSPPNREDELEIDSAIAVHEGFVLACTEHDRLQVLTKSRSPVENLGSGVAPDRLWKRGQIVLAFTDAILQLLQNLR